MNKEYEIVYCKECNAVKITEDDRSCLICNGTSEVIGFEHQVIQDILDVELTVEESDA
jgi:hypothetical protein